MVAVKVKLFVAVGIPGAIWATGFFDHTMEAGTDLQGALLQQQIVQTYVSLATMAALQQMGYSAEASQEEQQMVIRGIAYA